MWWHDAPRMRWVVAAALAGGAPAAVAWAPTGGRPTELVATAHGDTVSIWHLTGPADELQVLCCAVLPTLFAAPPVVLKQHVGATCPSNKNLHASVKI